MMWNLIIDINDALDLKAVQPQLYEAKNCIETGFPCWKLENIGWPRVNRLINKKKVVGTEGYC